MFWMISDKNPPQPQLAEPEEVQVTDQTSQQIAKSGRRKPSKQQDHQGSNTASSTQGASQRLKAVKQLSFRIDDNTHQRISLAAQRAGKNSINSWLEEVVSAAADDILESSKDAVVSGAIQTLLEEPGYATRLIEGVMPYLRDSNPPTVFQFSHALKKLLIGWDMIKPFVEEASLTPSLELVQALFQPSQRVTKLAAAVVPFLQETDTVTVLRYNTALKKLLLGFAAVAPFVKEKKTDNLLRIAGVVEDLLDEIQA
jgi:predicted HicB family RNase H-like nuclease